MRHYSHAFKSPYSWFFVYTRVEGKQSLLLYKWIIGGFHLNSLSCFSSFSSFPVIGDWFNRRWENGKIDEEKERPWFFSVFFSRLFMYPRKSTFESISGDKSEREMGNNERVLKRIREWGSREKERTVKKRGIEITWDRERSVQLYVLIWAVGKGCDGVSKLVSTEPARFIFSPITSACSGTAPTINRRK